MGGACGTFRRDEKSLHNFSPAIRREETTLEDHSVNREFY